MTVTLEGADGSCLDQATFTAPIVGSRRRPFVRIPNLALRVNRALCATRQHPNDLASAARCGAVG
jgi:hypothetical protein